MMTDEKGFSLLESLTALLVVSTMALCSFPAVSNWKDRQIVNGEARKLYSALQKARLEAAKINGFVALQFYADGYDVYVDNGAGGGKRGDWVRQPGETAIFSYRFEQGVRLVTNFTKDRTRFSGGFGNKAGTITIGDDFGNSMKVIVSLVGRVRVEKG